MSTDSEVREASREFYAALNGMATGNAAAIANTWAHSPTVTSMHPTGGREVGWDQVGEVFSQVAGLSSAGHVELVDSRIEVGGDLAYETGFERGQITIAGRPVSIDQRVTNVYRRDGGTWRMVHHHADLSPAMMEILRELQAGSRATAG